MSESISACSCFLVSKNCDCAAEFNQTMLFPTRCSPPIATRNKKNNETHKPTPTNREVILARNVSGLSYGSA